MYSVTRTPIFQQEDFRHTLIYVISFQLCTESSPTGPLFKPSTPKNKTQTGPQARDITWFGVVHLSKIPKEKLHDVANEDERWTGGLLSNHQGRPEVYELQDRSNKWAHYH